MEKENQYLERWARKNAMRTTTHVAIAGLEFLVDKDVFSPDPELTHSTLHLINNLPNLNRKNVLDMGTGAGILAIIAAKRGATCVLAVDINPIAVKNAKANVSQYNLNNIISVIESDLFENVDGKFDVIVANFPIWSSAWPMQVESMNVLYKCFFGGIKSHLEKNGKVLFSFASFGDMDGIENGMRLSGLEYKAIKEERLGVEWCVFESV